MLVQSTKTIQDEPADDFLLMICMMPLHAAGKDWQPCAVAT